MSFAVQFYNMPDLELVTTQKRLFYVNGGLRYSINGVDGEIPDKFVTDLGTVPDIFENVVENDDPHFLRGFILHDKLCNSKGELGEPFPRYNSLESAAILRAAGLSDGSPEWKADAIFAAVALKGPHWK